ncbi:MAG: hypothetical protein P8Y78_00095 [Acidihalobacter sp.]|jgi:hypothetical protein
MTSSDVDFEIAAQSFVDGELLASERLEFLEFMKSDEALRLHVSELMYQKELVRRAFSDIPEPRHDSGSGGRLGISRKAAMMLAALALMGMSLIGGMYVGSSVQSNPPVAASSGHRMVADTAKRSAYRLITGQGVEMVRSLAQVGVLLKAVHTQHEPVTLVVDEKALPSSKAKKNLYSKRINMLLQEHPNLRVLACGADTHQGHTHTLKAFSPLKTQGRKPLSLLSNC